MQKKLYVKKICISTSAFVFVFNRNPYANWRASGSLGKSMVLYWILIGILMKTGGPLDP